MLELKLKRAIKYYIIILYMAYPEYTAIAGIIMYACLALTALITVVMNHLPMRKYKSRQ